MTEPDARPRISVIIPARTEAGQIGRVLARIFAPVKSDCEIIVVVDTAEDPTWQEVQARAAGEPRLRCRPSDWAAWHVIEPGDSLVGAGGSRGAA